jgi:hypothetical protein
VLLRRLYAALDCGASGAACSPSWRNPPSCRGRIRFFDALAPVNRTIVDVAADSRLEHSLGNRSLEQVVLAWLEIAEVFGKYLERFADRARSPGFDDGQSSS